ncbi:uncharacterized protein LOC144743046 [Ciona intestinalis]
MQRMTWDKDLATFATNHVKNCVFAHSIHTSVGPYPTVGENLAVSYTTHHEFSRAFIKTAGTAWYNEISDYTYANQTCKAGKQCGHYTQMVWATTYKIGCGAAYCKSNMAQFDHFLLISCNYGTAGNILSYTTGRVGKPFEKGAACSDCANDGDTCVNNLCSNSIRDGTLNTATNNQITATTTSPLIPSANQQNATLNNQPTTSSTTNQPSTSVDQTTTTKTNQSPTTITNQSPTTITNQSPTTITNQSPTTTTNQSPTTITNQLPTTTTNQSPTTITNQSPTTITNQSPTTITNQSPTTITNQSPTTITNQSPTTITNQSPTTITNQSPTTTTNQSPTTITNQSPTTITNQVATTTTAQSTSITTQTSTTDCDGEKEVKKEEKEEEKRKRRQKINKFRQRVK